MNGSDGRLGDEVSFGVVVPSQGPFGDPTAIRDLAQAAEELGYDSVWFGDHVVVPDYAAALTPPNWHESLTCCTYLAGVTDSIRVGTEVVALPCRDPVVLATTLTTLDGLSGERFVLGVGVGFLEGEFEALDAPPYQRRGEVTDEYLEVMWRLWSSEGPVSFDGRWVSLEDVHFGPAPVSDPVPIWVGGNAEPAVDRAARLGSGWHPLFPTPEAYRVGRERIVALRDGDTTDFTFSYSCPQTTVRSEPATAEEAGTYDEAGFEVPDDYHYAPAPPRRDDGSAMFVGTPEQIRGDVEALRAAGAESFTLRFWTVDPDATPGQLIDQFERFADEVASLGAS